MDYTHIVFVLVPIATSEDSSKIWSAVTNDQNPPIQQFAGLASPITQDPYEPATHRLLSASYDGAFAAMVSDLPTGALPAIQGEWLDNWGISADDAILLASQWHVFIGTGASFDSTIVREAAFAALDLTATQFEP